MTADIALAELVERWKEAIQYLMPAIQQLIDSFKEIWNELSAIPCLADMVKYQQLQTEYPRVYNLAFNHPKERVRKKNLSRLEKYWRKQNGNNKVC